MIKITTHFLDSEKVRIELSSIREYNFLISKRTGKIFHGQHKNDSSHGEYVHSSVETNKCDSGDSLEMHKNISRDLKNTTEKLMTSERFTQTES